MDRVHVRVWKLYLKLEPELSCMIFHLGLIILFIKITFHYFSSIDQYQINLSMSFSFNTQGLLQVGKNISN